MAKATTYIEGIGRRKTSTARVRIVVGEKEVITINDKPAKEFFSISRHIATIREPLALITSMKCSISAHVKGGGVNAQAEAIRHGLARAIEKSDANYRADLKAKGLLTRDARAVERKKFGLKKARRAPQWSKR